MNDDQEILPDGDPDEEDLLQEELAKGEGMVSVPDDLPHARLVLQSNEEQTFDIRGNAVIGRFDDVVGPVDVDLTPVDANKYVSRKHAEIRSEGSKWFLKDLGSSNGTFVMGTDDFEAIDDEVEISDGELISFGNISFAFHVTQLPENSPF